MKKKLINDPYVYLVETSAGEYDDQVIKTVWAGTNRKEAIRIANKSCKKTKRHQYMDVACVNLTMWCEGKELSYYSRYFSMGRWTKWEKLGRTCQNIEELE